MSTKKPLAPWNLDGIFVCDLEDNIVCEIATRRNEALVNARLISSAPDLLKALERLEVMSGLAMPYDDPARVAARSAIRKALGEEK